MVLKTPHFWYRKQSSKPPLKETILYPLSWLYAFGHAVNQNIKQTQSVDIPVICIGNLVAGGSGKTPAAISLMQLIREKKLLKKPHFLTRGFGGSERGPMLVDYFKNKASETGDESLLLAKTGFTVVATDRAAGARFAKEQGADGLILDDGLQNPGLKKDISIAVIDGAVGFGNGKLLPAGPLREPLAKGLERIDAFVLVGTDKSNAIRILPEGTPLFQAHVEVDEDHKPSTMKKYVAFAGLGRPEKFYHLLQKLGYNIVGWHAFPDHHPYTAQDLDKLVREAKDRGAELLTTEKDIQRINEDHLDAPLNHLPIKMVWENEQALLDFVAEKLKSRGS